MVLGGSPAAQSGIQGPGSDSAQPLLRLSTRSLLAVIASRQSELWDHLPKVVTTAVYLWHLLILPLLLPLLAVGAVVALLCWVIGKIRTREPHETADAQTTTPE